MTRMTPTASGTLAGAAATAAMSGVMLAASRMGFLGEAPPKRITDSALAAVGARRVDSGTRWVLTAAAHLAYGTVGGALFAVLRRSGAAGRFPPGAVGLAYAVAIWSASYQGWIPALDLLPPPQRDRPGRPSSMLLAHIVYGATLGLLEPRLSNSPGAGER